MSAIAFLRLMLDAGLTLSDAMTAAEAHERAMLDAGPKRSKGAERQARYEERKRQKASEMTVNDDDDVSPSPSPPPQTPPPHPHPRREITTRARGTADFASFWDRYPRKKAKAAAERAYLKALKETDHETLVAGLDAQIRWGVFDRPEYSPHAASWLNAGRWADERDASGQGVAGGQNARPGRSGADDIASIVARRHAEDDARMAVPRGEAGLFGDDDDWRQGAIEGEYQPGDRSS